jgi:hypothetical protein
MFRGFLFALVAGMLALPAAADDRPLGCFGHAYSEEELRANPDQIVGAIALHIRDPAEVPDGQDSLMVWTVFANQGFIAQFDGMSGFLLGQGATCSPIGENAWRCRGEWCDNSEILIEPQPDGTLHATTDEFRMPWIAECGGVINIANNDETTVFRLERQDDSVCSRILENAPEMPPLR